MQTVIVRHALRTTLMSLVIVLVSGGLIPHASMQDAVMDIERSQQPDTANHDERAREFSDATIVVRWSQLAQDNAFAVDPAMTDPFPNARGWTTMYLAMHDALNAIVPGVRQYAFFGTDTSAHPIAAAAQAARDVMNHIYPTRQAENEAELAFWLNQVPDWRRKTRGINLGIASATAIINARANDSMLVFGEYALQDPLERATTASFRHWSSSTGPPSATRHRSRSARARNSCPPLRRRSPAGPTPSPSTRPRRSDS
jgi:hypothetical protein